MSNSTLALENQSWELVKTAIIDPENSMLTEEQTALLCRVTSLARVVDRHPLGKAALAIHRSKYPEISRRTACRDLQMAMELNVTYITFNYEFWHNWVINTLVEQIEAAKARGDLKAWAAGAGNLIKAIGEKVVEEKDPRLVEKHTFLIQINHHGSIRNLDTRAINDIPPEELKAISDAIYTEITEEDAEEMFKT